MIVSTTQQTLINSSQSLSQNNRHIEPKYGTIGGTLKFEDSLINEVIQNRFFNNIFILYLCFRLDHFSMWMRI